MKFKQITNKSHTHYKGKVYDLTVENIHSYNINNLIVHNSGGGSLVAYAAGITQVDPLQYGLIFERFLNPQRGKLPDIDSDFCVEKGWMVFDYLIKKYGREYSCNIATFGRLQLKAVIKDIAKALGIPFEEVNEVTRSIPEDIKHIDELLEMPEYRDFFKKYPDIAIHAKKLEGSPRHVSQHPAGIAITPIPVTDLLPVQNAKETQEGVIPGYLTQFEKEQSETAGLVKLDILKLKNVTEIRKQLQMINKLYGKNYTEQTIPLDDPKTWEMFEKGDTLGVFQFASNVAIPVIKKIKCKNIEELAAANSFIRPGTSGLDEYVAGKINPLSVKKLDPRFEKHISMTYGAIVFQEQIMGLISELMGISFGEADLYRRALEKPAKDKKGYVKKFQNEAVGIAVSRGFKEEEAELIKDAIINNSGYAFNKCLSGKEKIYKTKNQFDVLTIEEMYKIKNDRDYAKQTGHYALWKKYRACGYGKALSMQEDGKLKLNNIKNISYSGKKDVYLVTTNDEQTVRCTMNHNFPTPNGKKMLSELNIGDELYVLDGYEPQKYEKLNTVRYKNAPKKGQQGFQKGGPIGTWLFEEYRQNKIGKKCELCENIGKELHHKDGNHDNNIEENYQWLCVSCHKKQHYKMGRTKVYNKGLLTTTSKIKSIELLVTEDVYDIEMEGPNHNLLMENGIVVSNSHAVAYSLISYWTAWIKVNYPLVFYTQMFNGNLEQLSDFMEEAKKRGITINPPHVCYSKYDSTIENEQNKVIRIGLNAIKGIGPAAVESIINAQPFKSMDDFFERNNLRSVNKKVVEAAIKANAFEGLSINISVEDIPDNVKPLFKIETTGTGKALVVLSRNQMWFWYEKVNEMNSVKSIPNYAVPTNMIKGKYMDIYELATEDDNTIIIPEDMLDKFDLTVDTVSGFRTRKRPKGFLKLTHDDDKKIPVFRKPFIQFNYEMSQIKENYLQSYLKETEEFGYSFLSHPLEPNVSKIQIFADVEDGYMMVTAGIITDIIQRTTKTNKKYYWVILKTPRDVVRITFWDNTFKIYKNMIQKYKLIVVKGTKGYGGITPESVKEIKFNN